MKAIIAAAAALLLSGTAQAVDYAETGDAGRTLATAQSTAGPVGGLALNAISGRLGALDADLFAIYIANPRAFSASAATPGTDGALDTSLFLFDSAGRAIATNDDGNGLEVQAILPAGNALYAGLSAGLYYLGVSFSGNEPVNSANQLLFAGYPRGDTTAVRGAAAGLNPVTLATFNGNAYAGDAGAYRIALTGVTTGPAAVAAVPEPASWAMMIGGLGLAGGALRRRRRPARRRFA